MGNHNFLKKIAKGNFNQGKKYKKMSSRKIRQTKDDPFSTLDSENTIILEDGDRDRFIEALEGVPVRNEYYRKAKEEFELSKQQTNNKKKKKNKKTHVLNKIKQIEKELIKFSRYDDNPYFKELIRKLNEDLIIFNELKKKNNW